MKRLVKNELEAGRARYLAGDFDRALPLLTSVLDAYGQFPDVHNMVGVIDYQLGRKKEAKRHFEQALRWSPNFEEAAVHLAICYNEEGRYGDAAELCRLKRLERADDRACDVTKLDRMAATRLAELHAELADTYLAFGAIGRAVEHLCAAVKSCPAFPDYRLKLAVALRDRGDLAPAFDILDAVKRAYPDFLAARVQLGVTHMVAGDLDKAREEWSFVLDRAPEHKLASFYMAATHPPATDAAS